jgi:hypothetical protein
MGAVFLAHDAQLDRLVALKIPVFGGAERDTLRERFLREARAAARLSHPNLCPVFEVGQVGDLPYLTMAYIDGTSLAEIIRSGRLPPTPLAARWVHVIARAVQEAHRHGIIHRDLKPSNIIVNQRGEPIVTDFGLVYRAALAGEARLTQSGAMVGTPAYLAPEQAGGSGQPVGPGSDIYSLGVVLYEALTGRLPFKAATLGELLAQIARDPPPLPSRFRAGLDPALEGVCLKALAKRPEDRFASMTAFATALAPYAGETEPPAQQNPLADQQLPARRGTRGRWTKLGSAVTLWLAGLINGCRRRSSSKDAPLAPTPAGDSSPDDLGIVGYEAQLRRRRARQRAFLGIGVVAAAVLCLVIYAVSRPNISPEARNPLVTRDNYLRIKPGMALWEVNDILGPGTITDEDGLVVDAAGNFKNWSRHGGASVQWTGSNPAQNGKADREVKIVAVWRSGPQAITVAFLNEKVTDKGEEGLIGK